MSEQSDEERQREMYWRKDLREPKQHQGPEGLFMALLFVVVIFLLGVGVGFVIRVVVG